MVAGVGGEAVVVMGPLIHSPGTGKLKIELESSRPFKGHYSDPGGCSPMVILAQTFRFFKRI